MENRSTGRTFNRPLQRPMRGKFEPFTQPTEEDNGNQVAFDKTVSVFRLLLTTNDRGSNSWLSKGIGKNTEWTINFDCCDLPINELLIMRDNSWKLQRTSVLPECLDSEEKPTFWCLYFVIQGPNNIFHFRWNSETGAYIISFRSFRLLSTRLTQFPRGWATAGWLLFEVLW